MSDKYYIEYDNSERKWSIWLTTPSDPKAFDVFVTEVTCLETAEVIVDVLNHLKGYS
jgi:PhoPQ-activated pathogenicity-related protein